MVGLEPRVDDWTEGAPADGRLVAYVWWCGDFACDCSQAQIVHMERNKSNTCWVFGATLWWGTFRTEGDLDRSSTNELNREARRLHKHHNELFHRIEWPWDRKEKP